MAKKNGEKSGGRKKGTPNKRTVVLQQLLEENDLDPIRGLVENLEELNDITAYEPDSKVNIIRAKTEIYLTLMQYLYPKRKPVDADKDPVDKPKVIKIMWGDENEALSQDEDKDPSTKDHQ